MERRVLTNSSVTTSCRTLIIPLLTAFVPYHAAPARGMDDVVTLRSPLLRSIRFVDNFHGWIAGYNGVFYTRDGGKRWQRLGVSLGSISKVASTAATDVGRVVWADRNDAIFRNQTGLAYCSIRPLKRKAVPIPPNVLVSMEAIAFSDPTHGFASGSISHELFRTTDGGSSWETFDTPANDLLSGLFVSSLREVWVVGIEGIVLHSRDAGRSWNHTVLRNENGDAATGLRSIWFIDSGRGWACGPSGYIFHTANGGMDWQR